MALLHLLIRTLNHTLYHYLRLGVELTQLRAEVVVVMRVIHFGRLRVGFGLD